MASSSVPIPPAWQERIWSSLVGDPTRQDVFTMEFEERGDEVRLILSTSKLRARSPNLRPKVSSKAEEEIQNIWNLLKPLVKTTVSSVEASPKEIPAEGGDVTLNITLLQELMNKSL